MAFTSRIATASVCFQKRLRLLFYFFLSIVVAIIFCNTSRKMLFLLHGNVNISFCPFSQRFASCEEGSLCLMKDSSLESLCISISRIQKIQGAFLTAVRDRDPQAVAQHRDWISEMSYNSSLLLTPNCSCSLLQHVISSRLLTLPFYNTCETDGWNDPG